MNGDSHVRELETLVRDMRQWTRKHPRMKPDRKNDIDMLLLNVVFNVRLHPDRAKVALDMAKAMWHMLFEDAHIGTGVRHVRKPLPGAPDAESIKQLLDQCYRENPDVKNITELRREVCKQLSIGRSTLLEKTKYDPLKK